MFDAIHQSSRPAPVDAFVAAAGAVCVVGTLLALVWMLPATSEPLVQMARSQPATAAEFVDVGGWQTASPYGVRVTAWHGLAAAVIMASLAALSHQPVSGWPALRRRVRFGPRSPRRRRRDQS